MSYLSHAPQIAYWSAVDAYRNEPPRPYGIYMYFGMYGAGKTISVVEHLPVLIKKYPKAIIASNITLIDIPYIKVDSLWDFIDIKNGSDGVIFIFDEIQNTFNSRKYRDFNFELIDLLTQQRKQAKMFICTAQNFNHVEKTFRDLCMEIILCKSYHKGRYIRQKSYQPRYFDALMTSRDPKTVYPYNWKYDFVASDKIRESYDTYEYVEKLSKEKADPNRRYVTEVHHNYMDVVVNTKKR